MTTKLEHDHMNAVASLGCIVCRLKLSVFSPCIIHHVRSINGVRITRNHMHVLGLCPRHHAADYATGFHAGSRTWQRLNGSEESLLELVEQLLMDAA